LLAVPWPGSRDSSQEIQNALRLTPLEAAARRDARPGGGADYECINVETGVRKRVLIVDNEPRVVGVLLEFFARFQHGHAYDVVPAYSPAEALDILRRGAFDLILLDMVMPGIGASWKQGLDLVKRIRDLGVNAPVLMMSGGGDTRKAEALIAGAVGYLHKPFNLRDLDHSVALACRDDGM
jgi:CheY-like chemotaxis protein